MTHIQSYQGVPTSARDLDAGTDRKTPTIPSVKISARNCSLKMMIPRSEWISRDQTAPSNASDIRDRLMDEAHRAG